MRETILRRFTLTPPRSKTVRAPPAHCDPADEAGVLGGAAALGGLGLGLGGVGHLGAESCPPQDGAGARAGSPLHHCPLPTAGHGGEVYNWAHGQKADGSKRRSREICN